MGAGSDEVGPPAISGRAGLRAVARLGVRTTALILLHSARRRVQARHEAGARPGVGPWVEPGRLLEAQPLADGPVRFRFEGATLQVQALADDAVELCWGPWPAPPSAARSSAAGAGAGGDPPPTSVTGGAGADEWVVRAGTLTVHVGADAVVRVAGPDGVVVRTEGPPGRRGPSWCLPFTMRPGERLGGLGEQASGVDRRGERHVLWNTDPGGSWGPGRDPLYLGIPVLVGAHPDGDVLVLHDNPHRATVDLGAADAARAGTATVTLAGGPLRHVVVVGPVPALLDRYTALTGRPPLPPRWALGYHQSRWGYRCEDDVREVSDGFAEEGVPLSAVHLDIDYMDGYRVFTVDRRRFPDLPRLAAALGRRGTRLVAIVDPGVKASMRFPLFRHGRRRRVFCTDERGRTVLGVVWPGLAAFPDFTAPRARDWWADQYRTLVDAGIEGFWHDMNEPTSISVGVDPTLPLGTRHDLEGRGGDHAEGHNLYALGMNRAGYEGIRRARPGSRPFIVSRSGWAGSQRYAWNWTGDAETSWPSLRQQVATVVGLGLSGVPFSGPDIGGFSGVPDAELYLRWLQLSVFLPFCRTHSMVGVPPREPWRFAPPTRQHIGDLIRFRYRLLPYLYTLAHQAAECGAPLARPLWWPPEDEAGRAAGEVRRLGDVDDAFLLGDALLVAPVVRAGATSRTVPLPAGSWTSLWGDDVPLGPERVARLAGPPDRVPVLVRRGTVLPLDDGWHRAGGCCALDGDATGTEGTGSAVDHRLPVAPDHAPRRLAFHCWPTRPGGGGQGSSDGHDALDAPGGTAAGIAFDDAGDGDGPVRRDHLTVTGVRDGGTATCRWVRQGDHPAPRRVRLVLHGWTVAAAEADGRPVAVAGGTVDCAPFDELQLHGLRPG